MIAEIYYIRRSKTIIISLAAFAIAVNSFAMIPELAELDKEPDTWYFVMPYVFSCELDQFPDIGNGAQRNPLKWWLNCLSFHVFENYRIIPGFFGIAIIPLVYLLGSYITNDRFIGLVSLLAFVANPLYSDWATQGTYDQVWSFFFILSLVFIFKKYTAPSIFSMIASISAKAMAVILLPVFLYTVYNQSKNKKHVFYTIIGIAVISLIGLLVLEINPIGNSIGFYPQRWDEAVFRNISLFWQIIPALALLIVINRNFIPKQKMPNQKIVAIWMLGFFMINPIVYFFTLQDTYSYRYVPLAAFMSVFAGMTLVNLGNWIIERQLNKKIHA